MKIKIACFKNACLERKFKTDEKFLLGRGGFGEREERENAAEGGRRARDFKRGCSKNAENNDFYTKKKKYHWTSWS